MRKLILLLMLFGVTVSMAQTYTEFYVNNAAGDNLNSGHTPAATATFTATAGYWTNSTTHGTFFKSGLNPIAGGVTNGAFASVYTNDNTATGFVGCITNADDTSDIIEINFGSAGGTPPATDESGVMNINVGGAWKGPGQYWSSGGAGVNKTNNFPLDLFCGVMTNRPGVTPCLNIKSGTTYAVTNQLRTSTAGPMRISGYGSAVRDGTAATIDGGTAVAGYILWLCSGASVMVTDMIFANNGNNGTTIGVSSSGNYNIFRRCVFHDFRGNGISMTGPGIIDECEAYACVAGNLADSAGIRSAGDYNIVMNCMSHDNVGGANAAGFVFQYGTFLNDIAYNNSGNGYHVTATYPISLVGCEAYSNALAGIDFRSTARMGMDIRNCNFVSNKGMAITNYGNVSHYGFIQNCGFGSGTKTNLQGDIAPSLLTAVTTNGLIVYAADQTPWTAPDSGNFSIALAAAKAVGRSAWILYGTNSPTVGYPDIGAAQAADTNAAGGEHSHVFAQ